MSVTQNMNIAYSLNQPLSSIFPSPIISKRDPATTDKAPLGTEWINKTSNSAWILTSIVSNSATWVAVSGGAGSFSTLTVTGNTTLGSASGSVVTIAGGAGAKTVHIGDGAAANVITIGSTTGAASTTLQAGTGGMTLSAAGLLAVTPATATAASPTASVTSNNRVICATFTGFTTAQNAAQIYTINSSLILTTSALMVTVTNLNASVNNALIGIIGIKQAAGSVAVSTLNNGGGALGAGDNVLVTVWVLS